MADFDRRRDDRSYGGGGGYRGGGGRGGFNKRKRFREDDDDDRHFQRQQRPRHDPPGTRIRKGLLEIAENEYLPHENAIHVASLTVKHYDDEYVRGAFTTTILKLVEEQPFKIPFVAGAVLFAHAENAEVAQDVISKAGSRLQEVLAAGEWRETKLLLRFLACLSRVFEQDGILPILDELFNRAVDLQTASQEDAVGIELVKIILLTIPYLLASTEDVSLPQKVAELLEKTGIVASTPHQLEPLVDPFPASDEGTAKPMPCASFISLLQQQLQEESNNGWPLKCVPRVYDPSIKRSTANGDANGDANADANGTSSTKFAFPSITVPSPVNTGLRTLFPEIYFSLFADQEIESVPRTTNIASTLMRDTITDTLNILDYNRIITARFLSEFERYWPPNTFVKQGTTFDKLRDMEPGRPTWKPEDVAIDAIFSQIFALPTPEHRLVLYHSIVTELCKISPSAIAPSLGRAIRFLFRAVDVMDLELQYRYIDWFGHHLSNFDFRWKWSEWIPEVSLPDLDPKKAFIMGVLDKEIRLSFAKRIRESLPEPFQPLIPSTKEKENPDFKFNNDQTPFAKEGQEVYSLLKKKAPEEDIQRVLDSVQEQAAALGLDPLVSSTDVYMTSILSLGAKSLSHVLSMIDRCKERLLAVGPQSEAARRQVISSVMTFWAEHPGTAVNLVDKLLNYTIVTPLSVVQWALIDNMDRGRALTSAPIYELISITMFKVTNRIHQLLAARNGKDVAFEQRQQINEALPREIDGMRELFSTISDAVAGVAMGAQDEMIERYDGDESEQQFIKAWGARWARVWSRKAAVEGQIVTEGLAVPLEEPPQPVVTGGAAEVEEDMDQVA